MLDPYSGTWRPTALSLVGVCVLLVTGTTTANANEPVDVAKHHGGLVFSSMSMDMEAEVKLIVKETGLGPGMTFADVGGGDGTFIRKVGSSVMPGGHLIGTGGNMAETHAMHKAAALVDPSAQAFTATSTYSGLPPNSCDVIMLRMVYHMIPAGEQIREYLAQFKAALTPGGKLLLLDHNPDDKSVTDTRDGATMYDGAMAVVPQAVEKEEVEAAGFEAIGPVTDWPYFANGYKLLLKVADA